jgi:hypothetical protein
MSFVRRTTSLAPLARLSLLTLLLLGCGTEDRTATPTDGASDREEVVEVATELEVRDVDAAARTLRDVIETLGGHVEQSERAELARVRTEIEVAEAEERVLVDRVREASLDVTIRHHTPAWRDEPLAAMSAAFSGGIETSWSVLVALGVVGAALTPALVVLALLGLALRTMRRALARRAS